MEAQKIIDRLGFCGEQVLSYMDEIIKTPCPKCGKVDFSITFVGKNMIIRCSEQLHSYQEDEGGFLPPICNFFRAVETTNLNSGPFVLDFADKRATSQNRTPLKRGRGRPRKV